MLANIQISIDPTVQNNILHTWSSIFHYIKYISPVCNLFDSIKCLLGSYLIIKKRIIAFSYISLANSHLQCLIKEQLIIDTQTSLLLQSHCILNYVTQTTEWKERVKRTTVNNDCLSLSPWIFLLQSIFLKNLNNKKHIDIVTQLNI